MKVTHDKQTHELVISGVSQLHLDIIRERLKARFGVEVNTKEPKIPYRETINGDGAGDHKHKKQTGGRGQFAEVHLRIYPLPRDIKTQEQCEKEFANKSRFEKMRSVPLRSGVQLRIYRPHCRRVDSEQLHPGGGKGLQGNAGTRRTRRLPRSGHGGGGSLRQVSRRGLFRSGVQRPRAARLQESIPIRAAVACWNQS